MADPKLRTSVRNVRRRDLEGDPQVHWAEVLSALDHGALAPLAGYLRATNGAIDPAVAQQLANMIDGRSGWRLAVKRHPRLRPKATPRELLADAPKRERQIANFIAQSVCVEGLKKEAAIAAARAQFKIGRSKAFEIWAKYGEVARMRAHALAKLPGDGSTPRPA